MKKLISSIIVTLIAVAAFATTTPAKAAQQAPNASYYTYTCCSYDGYARCNMSVAVVDGTPCFCYGQGTGVAC